MSFRINYTGEARQALKNMTGRYRQRARRLIESLASQPRPTGARELRDMPNRYRMRLNGWRIIYRVDDLDRTVLILAVRHKKGPETYQEIE